MKIKLTQRIKEISKPIPYHIFKQTLIDEGYERSSVVTTLIDSCSNSKSHQTATSHNDVFYIKDGMCLPPKKEMCCRINPDQQNSFTTIKKHLNGEYLFIFPCTTTAKYGNYFLAPTWREMSMSFPERMTILDFAAVDCITAHYGDQKGLVVFENEMERVKGFDSIPTYQPDKVASLNRHMKLSLEKLNKYKKVYIYLNVKLYSEVVKNNILPNMHFIDMVFRQGSFKEHLIDLRKQFSEEIGLIPKLIGV